MCKPHGIIVFGANASGKSTLGRELARILNFKYMRHEDYHFEKSEIPYTVERSYEDCLKLMLVDIEKHRSFVLSAVTGDFGDKIPQFYELAVFISAPVELRMKRLEQRAYERHGERIRKGGDMYEQHMKFVDFVASRSLSKIEQWSETLKCPVIRIDGTKDWRTNAEHIAKKFYDKNGLNASARLDCVIGEDIMTAPEYLLAEALSLYSLDCPQPELIRHNENITYKIISADKKYVLRIHKRVEGFDSNIYDKRYSHAELVQGELDIISALKNGTDLHMQTPVCGTNGGLVQALADGTPVTLLQWVEGQTVESVVLTPEILKNSGKLMAEMHSFFFQCARINKQYTRYSYDQAVLPRIAEKIENAALSKAITQEQAQTILAAIEETRRRFDELDNIHEKQIVHADIGKSNVIVGADGRLTPIDFSLCGYSHFYMDIGGIFGLNYNDEGRKHIIEGYKSVRNCDIKSRYIEPYFALSVVLFISCQYERAKDWDWFPGNIKRWCRDIFKPLADNTEFIDINIG